MKRKPLKTFLLTISCDWIQQKSRIKQRKSFLPLPYKSGQDVYQPSRLSAKGFSKFSTDFPIKLVFMTSFSVSTLYIPSYNRAEIDIRWVRILIMILHLHHKFPVWNSHPFSNILLRMQSLEREKKRQRDKLAFLGVLGA